MFMLKGSNPKTKTFGFAAIQILDWGALPDKPISIFIDETKSGTEILPLINVAPDSFIKNSNGGTAWFPDIAL